MSILDWLIVIVPMGIMTWYAIHTRKYANSMPNFLVAGRAAGRYVLTQSGDVGWLSVITLVAICEQNYQTGFSVGFWNSVIAPISIFMGLYGWISYRWRETRALSFGEFLERRYGSKVFRVLVAILRSFSEMVQNALGPAIAAQFFIFFLRFPSEFNFLGITCSTYVVTVTICVILGLAFTLPCGRLTLVITDFAQSLLVFPIFIAIAFIILSKFSWAQDIIPTLANRVEGQSFLNPYDVARFRDFNLFMIFVSVVNMFLRPSPYLGNDTGSCAFSPHEQKMSGILGCWRGGITGTLMMILAIMLIVFFQNPKYLETAPKGTDAGITSVEIRCDLSDQTLENIGVGDATREAIIADMRTLHESFSDETLNAPRSQQQNLDTPYFELVKRHLDASPEAQGVEGYSSDKMQKFRTKYQQMAMPTICRTIFPKGLAGLFVLMLLMLLVTTDDSRIFNAAGCLMQDMVLPFFKRRVSFKVHRLMMRGMILFVGLFFWAGSMLLGQIDYLQMFFTIFGALWCAAAGPIILFGLYSSWGNIVGCWCSVAFGSGTALAGILLQNNWALRIYPWLERTGRVDALAAWLEKASAPFHPYIVWEMSAEKFPINSIEISFVGLLLATLGYIVGSLLTRKSHPFDIRQLLHRGPWADEHSLIKENERLTWKNVWSRLVGITSEYTRFDKFLQYFMLAYSLGYGFFAMFLGVVLWNSFHPWPIEYWATYFNIYYLIVPIVLGTISVVWFSICGIRDFRKMLRELEARQRDDTDNGQVM